MQKTVPLKEVVEQYLIESGQDTFHNFDRILNSAIRALKEIEWDITGSLVYKILDKTDNSQLEIPADCLRVIDLGVINRNGEFISIEYNANYTPKRYYDDCGNEVTRDSGNRLYPLDSTARRDGDRYYGGLNINRHGESTGRQYGIGGHSAIAQYGFDWENNVINISTDSHASSFMIIYLSNLSMANGDIMVHEFMVEPILAGIEWIMKRRLKSVSRGEKEQLKRNFVNEKRNLSIRVSSLSTNQLKFLGRAGVKAAKF